MKTNKDDIRALKNKHRLELVMQDTGEAFEVNSTNSDLWQSKTTPGLFVDIRRQIYEIKFPGKEESGDVIAWLKRRYSWSFGMVVKFLQKRPADPKRQEDQRTAKPKSSKATPRIEEPIKPLDHFQEKALQIGGERIRKYFSWSHWDIVLCNIHEEIRIDPTFAPQISYCQRCDQKLDWLGGLQENMVQVPVQHGYKLQQIGALPIMAYSIKHRLKVNDFGLQGNGELQDAMNGIIDALGDVFVEDEDGIVCVECASKEIQFHVALSLCERSARARERTEEEKQKQRAIEARQEQEQQSYLDEEELISALEADRDSGAGGKRTELL